jgi:hypothetical protein
VTVWKIVACAGAVAAEVSGTLPALDAETEFTVKVKTGAARPTPWRVTVLNVSGG